MKPAISVKAPLTPKRRVQRSTQSVSRVVSDETRAKQSAAKTGIPRSVQSRLKQSASISGSKHHAAKTWILLSPENKIIRTTAMNEFCTATGLNYFSLRNRAQFNDQRPISRGPSIGWSVLACKSLSIGYVLD